MSLDKFIRLADSLVVFKAGLNDKNLPKSSIHSLEVHKEELTSIWENLKSYYEQCLSDIENESQGTIETRDGADKDKEDQSDLSTVKHKYTSAYIYRTAAAIHEFGNLYKSFPHWFQVPISLLISVSNCLLMRFQNFDGNFSSWPWRNFST